MNNETVFNVREKMANAISPKSFSKNGRKHPVDTLPEILFITSYPPRECGIATYSQDLLRALDNKFSQSFSLKVCALEAGETDHLYPDEVKYTLDTTDADKYEALAQSINSDKGLHLVLVQHEFGFFRQAGEDVFLRFLHTIAKPVILVFHTVLPHPDEALQTKVWQIAAA